MVIKGLLIAGAAGLLSLPAFAQDTTHRLENSAQSPLTVNPAPQMPAAKYGATPPTTSRPTGIISEPLPMPRESLPPTARTGVRSDVVAVSPEVALATGGWIEITTSAPVPDTAANRAMYGGPMSATGRMTAARGN